LQSTLLVASVLNYPPQVWNFYPKDQPPCCFLADTLNPASTIYKSQASYQWSGFGGALDAERISWRQIFSGAE